MAKVEIKKKNAKGDLVHNGNYDIKLDGKDITKIINKIKRISIDLDANEKPVLTIQAHITDLDIKLDVEGDKQIIEEIYPNGTTVRSVYNG